MTNKQNLNNKWHLFTERMPLVRCHWRKMWESFVGFEIDWCFGYFWSSESHWSLELLRKLLLTVLFGLSEFLWTSNPSCTPSLKDGTSEVQLIFLELLKLPLKSSCTSSKHHESDNLDGHPYVVPSLRKHDSKQQNLHLDFNHGTFQFGTLRCYFRIPWVTNLIFIQSQRTRKRDGLHVGSFL